MKVICRAIIMLLSLIPLATGGIIDTVRTKGPDPILSHEPTPKEKERLRIEGNQKELLAIMRVDSVGWLKTQAFKRPDESMDRLEQERGQRKRANLIEFCRDARFEKTGEVDSLPQMTAEEMAFCKSRLKLVNPLMP